MDNTPLKTLLEKINTIKETWQIYEIFEEEKKKFKEEFELLEKDKKELIKSFNELSAKNAQLLAQNKDLEIKNKELDSKINHAQQEVPKATLKDSKEMDFTSIELQLDKIQNLLKEINFCEIKDLQPLKKIEVLYQKNQKLLANPAKNYIAFEAISPFLESYKTIQSLIQSTLLEHKKLAIELRDLKEDSLLNANKTDA